MLDFKNTLVGYDKPLFLVEDLRLEAGKFYTLAGRNGIGKTTFFRSILGLVKTKSGSIILENKNLHSFSQQELAKKIAFVPSRFDGVQHLNGRQYLAMGRAPYTNFVGTLSQKDKDKIEEIILLMKLEKLADRDTSELSDGERQLLSIAKALVQEAPIIILDEPTAFLDYPNRIIMLEILKNLAHTQKLCIIQSSHDLDLCLSFCDDFLLYQQGKLINLENKALTKDELLSIGFQD